MSVNRPGDNNTPTSTPMADALRTSGAASAVRPQASQSKPQKAGLMSVNSLLRRPLGRNTAGEATQALVKALSAHFDESFAAGARESFDILVLDNNSAAVALSAILVCYKVSHAGRNYVAVYTMAVEASGGRLAPKMINLSGQNVEIDSVAGDAVDKVLWNKIVELVVSHYGQGIEILNAGQMVLPSELRADDAAHIHRVAYNSVAALATVVEEDVTGAQAVISVSMIDNGSSLSATLDYNPAPLTNAVGLPVRNDVSVLLRGQSASAGANSPHEQVRDLTRVDAFIDLVYAEPAPPAFGQAPVTQRYYPRVVITNLDSQIDAITAETQLLALATAPLLSKQQAWGGAFKPRYTSGMDLRDIGAVGYEVQLDPTQKPDKFDTKADAFGNANLFQLLQTTVYDALIYSMDVEECGELSWLNQMFLGAANGHKTAYGAIVKAADNLTDGHFSRVFPQGAQIVVDDQNRIHLGYYVDATGERRDIRDIDYLAMLNLLGDRDMKTVIDWGRTFDDPSIPLEIRLEQRARLLKGLLSDMRIKGYARRLTFNPGFIEALAAACSNAGLVIRPNNLFVNTTGSINRGNYNAAAFAVSGANASGMFNHSTQGFGQYRGIGGPFMGRFGG